MRVYVQPALVVGRADIELAECINQGCKAAMITLSRGEHQHLSRQKLNGYARARAAKKAQA